MLVRKISCLLILLLSAGVSAQPNAETALASLGDVDGEQSIKLKLFQNTHHVLQGRADADFGKMKFKSRLFANNEVKFTLSIAGRDSHGGSNGIFGLCVVVHFVVSID